MDSLDQLKREIQEISLKIDGLSENAQICSEEISEFHLFLDEIKDKYSKRGLRLQKDLKRKVDYVIDRYKNDLFSAYKKHAEALTKYLDITSPTAYENVSEYSEQMNNVLTRKMSELQEEAARIDKALGDKFTVFKTNINRQLEDDIAKVDSNLTEQLDNLKAEKANAIAESKGAAELDKIQNRINETQAKLNTEKEIAQIEADITAKQREAARQADISKTQLKRESEDVLTKQEQELEVERTGLLQPISEKEQELINVKGQLALDKFEKNFQEKNPVEYQAFKRFAGLEGMSIVDQIPELARNQPEFLKTLFDRAGVTADERKDIFSYLYLWVESFSITPTPSLVLAEIVGIKQYDSTIENSKIRFFQDLLSRTFQVPCFLIDYVFKKQEKLQDILSKPSLYDCLIKPFLLKDNEKFFLKLEEKILKALDSELTYYSNQREITRLEEDLEKKEVSLLKLNLDRLKLNICKLKSKTKYHDFQITFILLITILLAIKFKLFDGLDSWVINCVFISLVFIKNLLFSPDFAIWLLIPVFISVVYGFFSKKK